MIAAWARICKILGKGFEPYLPYVMEPVIKAAGLKPEIALLDGMFCFVLNIKFSTFVSSKEMAFNDTTSFELVRALWKIYGV